MRLARFRLRTVMMLVVAIAVVLGLRVGIKRRRERFDRLTLHHSDETSRLYLRSMGRSMDKMEDDSVLDLDRRNELCCQAHWHDKVAELYRQAALRPWIPFEPDPNSVSCECSLCVASHRSR